MQPSMARLCTAIVAEDFKSFFFFAFSLSQMVVICRIFEWHSDLTFGFAQVEVHASDSTFDLQGQRIFVHEARVLEPKRTKLGPNTLVSGEVTWDDRKSGLTLARPGYRRDFRDSRQLSKYYQKIDFVGF